VPNTLAEQIALNEARAGAGREIIGSSALGDMPRLVDNYGPGEWVKMELVHHNPDGSQINIHWFRNKTTDQNVEFKFKIRDPRAPRNP
jgi:hypothetical protein